MEMENEHYRHSIRFIPALCKGCTHCLRACPTGAIRVREGKAHIIQDKCIACGECIRVCPNDAIRASSDELSRLDDYDFRVAVPTSPYFGQFREGVGLGKLVQALHELGFDEVFEEARGADLLVEVLREKLEEEESDGPLISTTCPAIIRFIQVKFPSLTENIVPLSAPVEVAARLARMRLKERKEAGEERLKGAQIGIFSIAPCPAQVRAAREPDGRYGSALDGVISIEEVYNKVMGILPELDREAQFGGSKRGLNWGRRDGEVEAVDERHRIIAVDGIRNVNRVLQDLEEGRLQEVEYLEARSCVEGCAGGVLTAEDPPIAKYKLGNMEERYFSPAEEGKREELQQLLERKEIFELEEEIEPRPTLHLHDDLQEAIAIMDKAEKAMNVLPGLDCAACGSPNCQAFAEDVAKGEVSIDQCPLLDEEELAKLEKEKERKEDSG